MFLTSNNIKNALAAFVSIALFAAVVAVGAWGGLQIYKRQFEAEAQNIVAVLRSGMSAVDGVATSLDAAYNSSIDKDPHSLQLSKVLGTYDFVSTLGRFESITGSELEKFQSQLHDNNDAPVDLWRFTSAGVTAPIGSTASLRMHYPVSLVKSRSLTKHKTVDLTGFDLASFAGARSVIANQASVGRSTVVPIPDEWQRPSHLMILRTTATDEIVNGGYLLELNLEKMASSGGVKLHDFDLSLSMFSEQSEFDTNAATETLYGRTSNSDSGALLSGWFKDNHWLSSFDVGDKAIMLEINRATGIPSKLLSVILMVAFALPLMFLSIVYLMAKRNQAQKLARIESEKLYQAQHRASVTLASIDDGVITTDVSNTILYANDAAEKMLGSTAEEMQGKTVSEVIVHQNSRAEDVSSDGKSISLVAVDGSTIYVSKKESVLKTIDGKQSGNVIVLTDVSVERALTQELQYKVNHDSLTGLANRLSFENHIDDLFAFDDASEEGYGVCFIDLDRFKEVNDTCGHGAGDQLLIKIARAFKDNVREQDVVARLGGDEFGIILNHCTHEDAMSVANRILEFFQSFYFEFDDHVFPVRCSIGLVHFDPRSSNRDDVIKCADAACYDAKNSGRNVISERVVMEEPSDRESVGLWLPAIKNALENDKFAMHVQSIASIDDGSVSSHELLLRMIDDTGALVSPKAFMKTAVRYEIAEDIDRWVLGHALAKIKTLPEEFSKDGFSINLSCQSIGSPDFVEFLIGEVISSGINCSRLCFEVREDDVLNNKAAVAEFGAKLRAIGCLLALDDFGAAMTSFSSLKSLPFSTLKIDGSLIAGLSGAQSNKHADYVLLKSISDFAAGMGLTTIAEQVEDASVLEKLKDMHINYAQGFAIAKPISWDNFVQGLDDQQPELQAA